ncbi:coiled-coil domain-containing protein 89-like [Alligator mississippiensis]|uniref:Coiled-coil domain-containing protein 89-like n=1 Tax=Alligator mississippiensis TaxID=8496 RepID=A0A151P6H1_ALLMI|nr:coiled-coil domain-containing protein 89-like [Alligator mississippiensis]
MDRGKMLQEKQLEVQQLEKLEAAEKGKQIADERFERQVADSGVRVQELQRQLEISRQAYNELGLQFEAYKKHSMDLLTKEKKLNTKLRHFAA